MELSMKRPADRFRRSALGVAMLTSISALAAPGTAAPPSAEEGRAIFALHCARCHGDAASGGAGGPPLRPAVQAMSEDAFAVKVLRRTHWRLPAAGAGSEGAARDAFVQGVLHLRQDDRAMPAWESEPEVASAVRSLHVYLAKPPR
jgi:mono/diheme cytochrome c family protein